MTQSRRDFLKNSGSLIVGFGATSFLPGALRAQGPFATHASHIDPNRLGSWLAVDAEGSITAYTGKCDFGQGIFTAQTQLVAEELCVAISRVKLVQCDTAICPDQGTTSGSQSTPTNFNDESLALAAATAREALLNFAADRFAEPVDTLDVTDGVVTNKTGGRVSYAELVQGKYLNLPLNKSARRRSPERWTTLGKPVRSLDRASLMTGTFEFVHHVRLPEMLHARVVRPPRMGSTVENVDEASVRNLPGIVKVVVRKNFVGVVAVKQHQAVTAARQLAVQWNPGPKLPKQQDFFKSMRTQPSRDALSVDSGDVDSHFRAAKIIVKSTYSYPYQMHGSVGASCAVADVQANQATVWSATQSVYPTRSILAMLLGLKPDDVRVVFVRGAGCYGLNGADAVSFEAAILSQAVGKPVRLQFSRQDEMAWENYGSACLVEQKAAIGDDGQIAAWDREAWVAALGNRTGYDQPGNLITGMLLGYEPESLQPTPAKPPKGQLRNQNNVVPAYFAGCIEGSCGTEGTVVRERALTHTVRSPFFTGPLRSPLRIQNTFANECFMDELSARAKADPVAYRLQHLKNSRVIGVLKAAAELAKWDARPSPKAHLPRSGIASGRGVACVAYEGTNGYAALIAYVDVDLESGVVQPKRFVVAVDCGPISNPDGLRNQTDGGILQGMSRTLVEEVMWDESRVTSVDWQTYKSLYLDYEMPQIECVFVAPEGVPALGAGETSITVVPAAIGNAVFDATGARLRDVPFIPERVKIAMEAARKDRTA
jgi:nicotinate dehydrogenase subunit B